MSLWKPTTATKTALVWKSQREDGWGEDYKNISVGCLINRWYNKKEPGLFILKSSVRLLIVWTSKTTPWVCRVDALIICRGSTGQYTVRYSTVQYSVEAINLTEVSRAPSLHSTQYNYSLPRPWLMLYKQAIN